MSAIGWAYKSDREEVKGWESVLIEKKHSAAMQKYIEAKFEADRMWQWFVDMADTWIERRDYDALHEAEDKANQADAHAHILYLQANCPHIHRARVEGQVRVGADGSANDDSYEYCEDCGAVNFGRGWDSVD